MLKIETLNDFPKKKRNIKRGLKSLLSNRYTLKVVTFSYN